MGVYGKIFSQHRINVLRSKEPAVILIILTKCHLNRSHQLFIQFAAD